MKNKNWWDGFLVGFAIGFLVKLAIAGVIGIFALDLLQRGIL